MEKVYLMDKMSLLYKTLQHLEVSIVKPEEYTEEELNEPKHSLEIGKVTEKQCEIFADHQLLYETYKTFKIKLKVRFIFEINKPIERSEIEAQLEEIQPLLLSPVSLITAFITDQIYFPLIVPPWISEDENKSNS